MIAPIQAEILGFARTKGGVKVSSFNMHLAHLEIRGADRARALELLEGLGFLTSRAQSRAGVRVWRITERGE